VQYRFNLTLSNALLKPIWYPAYSMKENYNLTSLAPDQFKTMVEKMGTQPDLFEKYEYNYNGGFPVSLPLNSTICYLLSAIESEFNYCSQKVFRSDTSHAQYLKDYLQH